MGNSRLKIVCINHVIVEGNKYNWFGDVLFTFTQAQ